MKNKVFIATSIDGYIADKNGGIDWLHSMPDPTKNNMGYAEFMEEVDAIIMGRNTFETVCAFDVNWPYNIPVFVLSNQMTHMKEEYAEKAILVKGDLQDIIAEIHNKGHYQLYIDGGKTIQSFLAADLIDEITITTIPYLLGSGTSLFSELPGSLGFACTKSKLYLKEVVQNTYVRKR